MDFFFFFFPGGGGGWVRGRSRGHDGHGTGPGGFVLFWGLFVFVFTAWTITNRESLCRPLLNPNAVR